MEYTVELSKNFGRKLILDELFDLELYRRLALFAGEEIRPTLEELIAVESTHYSFWNNFFKEDVKELDWWRKVKLAVITLICRLFGSSAIHLTLEAIEVHGVRKYLQLWEVYKHTPLGDAVKGILEDEFRHEDKIVSQMAARRIDPEKIRSIFLGFNDGSVEILAAVSGFFAAFQDPVSVLIAGLTVSVAGSISMGASAYAASSSEHEVRRIEEGRKIFLQNREEEKAGRENPLQLSLIVALSYFIGAMTPIFPVLLGAQSPLFSIIFSGAVIIVVSTVIAFLSGMNVFRRIGINLVIIAAAVGVTYGIGIAARAVFGI